MTTTLKKVLLINGEPNMRELVQMCLSYLGSWQVTSVSSPVEGLQQARQAQPDVILLDLFTSTMSYRTFLQLLRAEPATYGVPVIVLTANAKWFDLKSSHPFQIAGVIDYYSDPVGIPGQIANLLKWDEETPTDSTSRFN